MNDYELNIKPVDKYSPPEIPTLSDDKQPLLKRLPKRWKKNAKVIACLGMVGAFIWSRGGCTVSLGGQQIIGRTMRVAYGGYSRTELAIRMHAGGSGSSFYVVYLTEQEAMGIIRARLEAAGFDFSARPPGHTVTMHGFRGERSREISLHLFDKEKGIAITALNWLESNRQWDAWGEWAAAEVERDFAAQTNDFAVHAFYSRGAIPDVFLAWANNRGRVSRREAASFIPTLKADLHSQIDTYIALLQFDGILELPKDISVIVNENPVEFELFPVLVNNQVMVCASELLETLGMEALFHDVAWGYIQTVTKDGIPIGIGRHVIRIGDDWENWIDLHFIQMATPAFTHNDKLLIPIQYLAEAINATTEWSEETNTIKITTN